MIIFFIIFAALAIGFLIIVGKLIAGGRKIAWKGTLVDKLHKTKDEFDSKKVSHFYTLVFKTETGAEIKVGTSKERYDEYNVGDRAEKKSGEFWPKKVTG
ncbi:MAG: hypothetical protein WC686_03045 [Candidatus Shapirobacteria bacterium]